MAAEKRLPVHHHSADYIFWSICITEFIFSYLKIEFRLSRCLGTWPVLHTSLLVMNRLNTTEFAILLFFFFSCGPCFKEISLIKTYGSVIYPSSNATGDAFDTRNNRKKFQKGNAASNIKILIFHTFSPMMSKKSVTWQHISEMHTS